MNDRELELYTKIRQFQLDDPTAVYKLSNRLAQEHHWSDIYTLRSIHEYKKFIFLATIVDRMVSPSMTVDLVWHQHLLYTHSYWHDFCGKLLNKPLHHYPSGGRAAEVTQNRQRYQFTLEMYQAYFGNPPSDIWDSASLQSKHLADRQRYRSIPNPINWLRNGWRS